MKNKIIYSTATIIALSAVAIGVYYKTSNVESYAQNYLSKVMPTPALSMKIFVEKIHFKHNSTHEILANLKNQAMHDELEFQNIKFQILSNLQKELMTQNSSFTTAVFNEASFTISGLPTNSKSVRSFDQIEEFVWGDPLNFKSTPDSLLKLVNNYKQVEDLRFDVTGYNITMSERDEVNLRPFKMTINGGYDSRGITLDNKRRQDSSLFAMNLVRSNEKWKIETIQFSKGKTLVSSRAPAFKEITAEVMKGNKAPIYLRREAIRRGGYALAITDTNNDGLLDLFLGTAQNSLLYEGQPNQQFKLTKTFDEKMVKTAVFADLNNNGFQDLFMTSFSPNSADGDIVIYSGDTKGLTKIGYPSKKYGRLNAYEPMPATVGDFNADGLLDLYVGFPGKKDFTFTSFIDLNNDGLKKFQGLFISEGNYNFRSEIVSSDEKKLSYSNYIYPHSSMALDWNKDKLIDLVVIDDQDNLSPIYKNLGSGVLKVVNDKIGIADSSNAMSFAAGDINNDGLMDFVITSANLNAAKRYDNAMDTMWSEAQEKMGFGGNAIRLFVQQKDGTFLDTTKTAGLQEAGEGAAGVEFLDYNNDGLEDIYLTNGLWSGNNRDQDAGHLLVFAKLKKLIREGFFHDKAHQTQSDFMDFLTFFKGDLSKEDFKGTASMSAGGYQRNRLFRNNGDGTYTDVAYLENIDSINDGYIIAKASFSADGRQDIILRNGDPGQEEYKYPTVQIFKNNFPTNLAASIKLIAKSSNRDAIGVGATAYFGNKQIYQQIMGNNGPSQSERKLHFGMGVNQKIDRLVIHWASADQILYNVNPGNYVIEEKEKLSIVTNE